MDLKLKELVLIGGGHGHVHVLKMFGMNPLQGVQITLISRDSDTPYSGMLPGYVAGYYTREECHLDLRQICSFASIRFIREDVKSVDTHNKMIYFHDSSRPPMTYDVVRTIITFVYALSDQSILLDFNQYRHYSQDGFCFVGFESILSNNTCEAYRSIRESLDGNYWNYFEIKPFFDTSDDHCWRGSWRL